jgi:AraC family transcriptional activator of pobA
MKSQLPTYLLYGDKGNAIGTDWLHCESIAERSRLHDWEIRPHRHESLFQILHIGRGSVQIMLDGVSTALRGPCVVLVPSLSAHGFSFAPDVDGIVVTVFEQHLTRLLSAEPGLRAKVMRPLQQRLGGVGAQHVARAANALCEEFLASESWRGLAIDAALMNLVIAMGRSLSDEPAAMPAGARALAHVQRFRSLIERRFREQPALSQCAEELGLTTTQLNRVCRQVLGHTALAVLHARLMLEAQRDLAYTTMSIKQIGLNLGFADAGYFTRFFQRETGRTPTAWRSQAARTGPLKADVGQLRP